jgi:hypothetical protein
VIAKKILAGVLAAGAVAIAAPATAQAAPADDPFAFCWPAGSSCGVNGTSGVIRWGNRTAVVNGTIWHDYSSGSSQVRFRAFAAGKQIGPEETRTVHAGNPQKNYDPIMGDTNLRGGIDRIDARFCSESLTKCTSWYSYFK